MSDETHESEHRPEDRPIHVHYLDKLPDPSLFPANVRFVPTPGCSTEPGGSIGSTVTVHTEDGYQRHPASRLEQPRVGDRVERGQVIGRLGTDRLYQHYGQSFLGSLDYDPSRRFALSVEQQWEYMTTEASRRARQMPTSLEEALQRYNMGPDAGASGDVETPAPSNDPSRPYTEKLGDPADNGYDKGH